jgi:hypothetical protein
MSIARLETVAPDLAQLLRSATSADALAAGVAAARLALHAAGVRERVVDETLGALDRGAAVPSLVSELKRLVERYDETYFKQNARGDGSSALTWFSQARALSALMFAAAADPLEACYESHAATDDIATLRATIKDVLRGQRAV